MSSIRALLNRTSVRYALASGLALGLDFALTFILRIWTPLSLTASAAIAFVALSIVFYFIHEFWTFRREGAAVSGTRLTQNLLVVGLAFVARIGTIGALDWIYPSGIGLGVLYFMIGVIMSFTINFLCNRYWVFTDGSGSPSDP